MKYDAINIRCEICDKIVKGVIGLCSHVSQSNDHPNYEEYLKLHPIDKYTTIQMKIIFFNNFEIDEKTQCWLWTGYVDCYGYGELYSFGKRIKAHRFSYQYFNGEIPEEICVCHTCDTPKCVNPEHLWLGTNAENTNDSVKKGRRSYLLGETNPSKRPEVREKISKALKGKARPSMIGNKNNRKMFGDDNPMRRPEVVEKCFQSRRKHESRKQNE